MLKDNLSKWLECHRDTNKFEALQKILTPKCYGIVGPSFSDIRQSFVRLLVKLQESDMLPCIVFALDRTQCEILTRTAIRYCLHQEKLYQEKHGIREGKASTKEKLATKKERDKDHERQNKGYLIFFFYTCLF